MQKTIIAVLVAALVGWVVSSFANAYAYKQEREMAAEVTRYFNEAPNTEIPIDDSFVTFSDDELEIGLDCIVQSIGMDKGCRMFSNAQACKQIGCERDKCTDDGCSQFDEAWSGFGCDLMPSVCVDPGPGFTPPDPEPPRVRCKWYDIGCRWVFDNEIVY